MTGPVSAGNPVPERSVPASIVGIGCRLPGIGGVDQFWRVLVDGRDCTSPPPPARHIGEYHGGYLSEVTGFDNAWFGISEREAAAMDPQQRLCLEVAVEALDDAALSFDVRGSGAAVLVGASSFDHGAAVLSRPDHVGPYAVTGSALSIIANRISYVLDLHGPSLVLDSACSSSLAAVDLACRLLESGEVPLVLVGGVNLQLLPFVSASFAAGGFLAADGRCKTFDAAADGYTRAEGCVVLVLRRTADARRDGDRVYAEILGTAVNSDGRSNGIYAPNGRAQQAVVRRAWARSGRAPAAADYIECHGTGTALGDAVEVAALAEVLGTSERAAGRPLHLGSVKSNVGHLEAGAGLVGLAKAALSIHRGIIPPNATFVTENPLLKLAERGMAVAVTPYRWDRDPADRLAGVSSFGFGGTNAHAVVGGVEPDGATVADAPVLIGLSETDSDRLRASARRIADWAAEGPQEVHAADIAATCARPRPHRARLAVIADSLPGLAQSLDRAGHGSADPDSVAGDGAAPRGPVLLFPGQGGQHSAMGRALCRRYGAFRTALREAVDAITEVGGPLVRADEESFVSGGTTVIQCSLFAYQVALAALLRQWGVEPSGVIGHSLGEIAAAHVCGALGLEDAARVVVSRSRALATLDGRGAMLVAELTAQDAARAIAGHAEQAGVAAINGPRSVVLSGTVRAIDAVRAELSASGVFVRPVAVGFAAHSPQVDPLRDALVREVAGIRPLAPAVPLYSTTRPGLPVTAENFGPAYWAENMRSTVRLHDAVRLAVAEGHRTFVEVSPHPVLFRSIAESGDTEVSVLPAADRTDETRALLRCLAELFCRGVDLSWDQQPGRLVSLPARSWRHRTFPLRTDGLAHPTPPPFFPDDFDDHVVGDQPIVPGAGWVIALAAAARSATGVLTEVRLHERIEVAVARAGEYIVSRRTVPAGVHLAVHAADEPDRVIAAAVAPERDTDVEWARRVERDIRDAASHEIFEPVPARDLYRRLAAAGLAYGERFRILVDPRGAPGMATSSLRAGVPDAVAVDGCLQTIAIAASAALGPGLTPLPVRIDRMWRSPAATPLVRCLARVTHTEPDLLVADVVGIAADGSAGIVLAGVHLGLVPALGAPEVLLREHWEAISEPPRDPATSRPVLVVGATSVAHQLADALAGRARHTVTGLADGNEGDIEAALGAAAEVVVCCASGPSDPDEVIEHSAAALALLQRLVAHPSTRSLTVILESAGDEVDDPCLGAVAGLVRTLMFESGREIVLARMPGTPTAADFARLTHALGAATLPSECLIRQGRVFTRKLARTERGGLTHPAISDGTYLVTGGLGAIGAAICAHLLASGAGEIVIGTRRHRELPPELRAHRHRVTVVEADVAVDADVRSLVDIARSRPRPLRGVVHAAGLLEDAEFAAVTPAQLGRMHRPKLVAAHNLLAHAPELDFVVLCSSMAGTVGSPGQAAYASANAALDALAARHRRAGQRVVSIAWGPWAGRGLAEGGAAHLPGAGVGPLRAEQALVLLDIALSVDLAHVAALRYAPTRAADTLSRRLREMVGPAGDHRPAPAPASASATPIRETRSRPPAVPERIRAIIATALHIDPHRVPLDAPFSELGIDSLLALEVRRTVEAAFGVRVSTADVFGHPTVTALAALVDSRLSAAADDHDEVEGRRAVAVDEAAESPAGLTDEQLATRLSAVLRAVGQDTGDRSQQPIHPQPNSESGVPR
ncbi:phthiocerol/phenolphthiocerol synthesis type-I polyketide synthase D [Nocardia puris]|uniref:Phthiocerol/phenolphthiocerol synthesis type-I polyketide synthase D n=1 Tax=Nocardia puris TaxID=208602 RepID=A0A366E4R4_9NOCA|nr:phthiocerol/phenolphthiocerol synthesis type-I polyketide synthase D [Nocardia puris]